MNIAKNLAMKKDNTKSIITLGFCAIFALMISVIWLSMATLNSVTNSMSTLVSNTEQKTSRAYQMRDNIRERSHAVRSLLYIDQHAEIEKTVTKLAANTRSYITSRSNLIELGANKREQLILEKIEYADQRVSAAYNKANEALHSMVYRPNVIKSALNDVLLQELVLQNDLSDLVMLESKLAQEALSTSNKTNEQTQALLLALITVAFLLSLLISLIVINRVASANRKIAQLASHDDLTGLHNRRSFEAQLTHTISIAQRTNTSYGLLYLDLDRFKIVNDTCGHHAGDQLLIQITQMIQSQLRKADLFARVGGDEFAIIAQGNAFSDIARLAEKIRLIVSDFTFKYDNQTFKVSLSIGAIPINGDVTDIESLLIDVDSACYVAKQSGRNRVHITQQNDAEVVKYRNDLAAVQTIRHALDEERLMLHYQPVYRLLPTAIRMEHCEILLRMKSKTGELLSPSEFIPLAEKYNMMHEIDTWVVTRVLDWVAAHQSQYDIPRVLINLSGKSFTDEAFINMLEKRLQHGDINPRRIAFEITETAAIENWEQADVFIRRISHLGPRFALDDFGSGLSTFTYLKKWPIDYLKIDGSLISNINTDPTDKELVRAINEIAHTVGAKTIAECVEDKDTLSNLRQIGVDYVQGYGLSKPKGLPELVNELRQPRTNRPKLTVVS